MKRILSLLCALVLLAPYPARAAGLTVQAYDEGAARYGPARQAKAVELLLDGLPLETDLPALLWDMGDGDARTLAPIRTVAEALGAQVSWDGERRQATLRRGEDAIVLTLGEAFATVNGAPMALPGGAPALLARWEGAERTMVPLRFVAEAFGAEVVWDSATGTARISTGDLSGRTVVLDPGHGGKASGAAYEGVLEKEIDLAVTLRVKKLLEERGCRVILTREEDRDVDLYRRCAIANQAGAEVFVSIHANAAVNAPNFQGSYTYYHPDSAAGAELAGMIQARMVAAAGSVDRGIQSENFVVVRETKMPAALVETGFMTCHEELERLTDPAYQDRLARGIAAGIGDYLKK